MWGKKTRLIVELQDRLYLRGKEITKLERVYDRKCGDNASLHKQNENLSKRLDERTAALQDMTQARSEDLLLRSKAEMNLEEAEELHEQLLQDQFDAMQVRITQLSKDVEHWKCRLTDANRLTHKMTTYYGPLVERVIALLRPAEAWWNEPCAPDPWEVDDAVQQDS